MSLTKEDISAIVESVVVANTKLAIAMMSGINFKELTTSMQTGLVFTVEAAEVRQMLQVKATMLRKSADDTAAAVAKLAPAYGADSPVVAQIARLRALADHIDWQAKHLAEKQYNLSMHEIEAIAPLPQDPVYTTGRPPICYDPAS